MRIHPGIPLLIAFVLAGFSLPAEGGVRNVDCNKGDSLQAAIERGGGSALPIEIQVSGECVETISVRRSNVAIRGEEGTTIVGHFRVFGADNVRLQDLTITGPGNGLTTRHSRVRLFGVDIVGNDGYGVAVRDGSSLAMNNGSISGNNGDIGLLLENSSANLSNVDVSSNFRDGIVVNINSTLTMIGGGVNFHDNGAGIRVGLSSAVELVDLHVGWNTEAGLIMAMASAGVAQGVNFNANGEFGILLADNSALDVNGGSVSWNGTYGALVLGHALLALVDSEVQGNEAHGVVLETDGGLFVRGETYIDGNFAGAQIECRGKEASIDVDPMSTIGSISCPDPDF